MTVPIEDATSSTARKTGFWNRRPVQWLSRALLAVVVGLLTLKIADFAVGLICRSQQRHLLRLAPNTSVRHRSREFDYEFRTNSLGFRGPDIAFDKPPGTRRIVVVGDSFIAGYGVADADLLTQRLQARINGPGDARSTPVGGDDRAAALPKEDRAEAGRVEVVNVGRVGASTVRELDLYEVFGSRFHPDVVILVYYFGNDLAEAAQELPREELSQWHPPGAVRRAVYWWCPNVYLELAMLRQSRRQLREFAPRSEEEILGHVRREALGRNQPPDEAERRYRALPEWFRQDVAAGAHSEQRAVDACLEPDRLLRALDPDDTQFELAWGRTETHLDRLNQAVRRDRARLVIVAIPAPFQVDPNSLDLHRQLGLQVRDDWLSSRKPRAVAALEEWAQRAGVPYCDLTPACRHAAKSLFFVQDIHFNPAGNDRAAEQIARFLQIRQLLQPARPNDER